jgi:hypothetical protein
VSYKWLNSLSLGYKNLYIMLNKKQTSPKVASEASDLLRNAKNPEVKRVSASDLSQAPLKKKILLRVKKKS